MIYGKVLCKNSYEACFQDIIAALIPQAGRGRLWLVFQDSLHYPSSNPSVKVLRVLAVYVSVEHVVSGGRPNLYLIEDTESLIQIATATDMLKNIKPLLPRKPSIRSTFDGYLREDMLIYVKDPCGAEDVQETFFLHVDPADASDLPEHRRRHGFDNLAFRFNDYGVGVRSAERCVALYALPDYDFIGIRTGQFLVNEDGGFNNLWEGEMRLDE